MQCDVFYVYFWITSRLDNLVCVSSVPFCRFPSGPAVRLLDISFLISRMLSDKQRK